MGGRDGEWDAEEGRREGGREEGREAPGGPGNAHGFNNLWLSSFCATAVFTLSY